MNSKRFVISMAVLIFALVGIIYGALWLLPEESYMQGEYSSWQLQREYSMEKHEDGEIVLLGDSRMKFAVNARQLSDKAYNLSLAGSSTMDMYYTLVRYLAAENRPQAVYVGFAPTHFTHYENYLDRGMAFHYYDRSEYEDINAIIKKFDGIDFSSECRKYEWRSPAVYMQTIIHSFREDRAKINADIKEDLLLNRGSCVSDYKRENKGPVMPEETKEKHFRVQAVCDYYLMKILLMCREHNIPVTMVQLPMGEAGVRNLEESGYMQEYEMYLQDLAERTGVEIERTIPVYEDELFVDDSHLNKQGQERYTAQLARKLDR